MAGCERSFCQDRRCALWPFTHRKCAPQCHCDQWLRCAIFSVRISTLRGLRWPRDDFLNVISFLLSFHFFHSHAPENEQGMNGRESEEKEKKRKAGAIPFLWLVGQRSKGLHFVHRIAAKANTKKWALRARSRITFPFSTAIFFYFLCIRRIINYCVFAGEWLHRKYGRGPTEWLAIHNRQL